MTSIQALMNDQPVSLDPEARIEDAWRLMRDNRIRHVPIVKNDNLVGLVTQKDLLVNAQNASLLTLPVAEVMVFNVKSITEDTDVLSATRMMLEERISCLPVVEDKKLKGIITESDLLSLLASKLQEEHA